MELSAVNIETVTIQAIEVVAYRPGKPQVTGRITDESTIRNIQRACHRAERATCHMESFSEPKFFLNLLESGGRKVGSLEVQAHVVVVGTDIVFTPDREVWRLVQSGLKPGGQRKLAGKAEHSGTNRRTRVSRAAHK